MTGTTFANEHLSINPIAGGSLHPDDADTDPITGRTSHSAVKSGHWDVANINNTVSMPQIFCQCTV